MLYQRIFELLVFLSEGAMFFYYAQSLFEQKRRNTITIGVILFGYITLMGIYFFANGLINTGCMLVVNIILLLILFHCNFKNAVFHSSALVLAMLITEFISALITSMIMNAEFNIYSKDTTVYILNLLFSKMLYFFFCLILAKLLKPSKGKYKFDKHFWMLMVVPISVLIVLTVLFNISLTVQLTPMFKIFSSISAIILVFSNIVLFFVYERSVKNANELIELKSIEQKAEIDNAHFEILERQNKNLMVYAHDTKNHLQAIRNMTDDESIIEYLEHLTADLNKYSRHASSGNHNLDVIINKYVTECEIKGVSFDYDVRLSNLSGVQMFDLVSILGNLLDNALESAEKSGGKSIRLQTDHRNTYDVIVVTNSCDVKPVAQGNVLKSSKANKKQHGLGIKSIKSALKNYSGDYNWEYNEQNKEFISTVMILRK